MRVALDFLEDPINALSWAESVAADVSQSYCVLAVTDAQARTALESKDRLRTIFRFGSNCPVQLVDSQFLLEHLRDRLDINNLRTAFNVARALGSRSVMGTLFEEMLHKWFQKSLPGSVAAFVRSSSEKTRTQGVEDDLVDANSYWVPGIPNFTNIDAALVDVNNLLHCVQYTVMEKYGFNQETFKEFLDLVLNAFPIRSQVSVYFAVPTNVTFSLVDHDEFEHGHISCRFVVVQLDMSTDVEIASTAAASFPFL
mmetsp:Transcript_12840/g.21323  ORF Transcript_12840/g.21323 Transcript_12840/m.21323 type:complete len:255 (-) Transcript_12840:532-1296(-)|eukprot:CAMPEP_0119008500 /NCGR_PEP_ID=MMETSP1176-20130426/3734_1 /TAXON_ID=265551 /ORGANISM="Synedropsis recta cf, Strain CCMP1620" /LENGTH=254 /DNA_ID=CAMNT_0006960839 /DNA_START=464 /DNA_END=1228 /DNA_ORIENTATION=-